MLDKLSKSDAALKDIQNFIAGDYVAAQSGRVFDKRSPVDGRLIARVAEAGEVEVDAAVRAARAALDGPWGKLQPAERGDMLYAVANEINKRFDIFLEAEVADTGKPVSLASISTFRAAPPTSRCSPTRSRTSRPNSLKWRRRTAPARSTTRCAGRSA